MNKLKQDAFYQNGGINLRRRQREGKHVNIPLVLFFYSFPNIGTNQEKDILTSKKGENQVQGHYQGRDLQIENSPRDSTVSGHGYAALSTLLFH